MGSRPSGSLLQQKWRLEWVAVLRIKVVRVWRRVNNVGEIVRVGSGEWERLEARRRRELARVRGGVQGRRERVRVRVLRFSPTVGVLGWTVGRMLLEQRRREVVRDVGRSASPRRRAVHERRRGRVQERRRLGRVSRVWICDRE